MAATRRKVDLTNVKERSNINPARQAEGDYLARIESVDDHQKTGDDGVKKDMWVFVISTPEDNTRARYAYYCGFEPNVLFKIKNLWMSAGVKVGNKVANLDPNKLVGKEIGIYLKDDEYEGKVKSVIDMVFPVDELSEDQQSSRRVEDDDEEEEVEELDLGDDEDEESEDDFEDEPLEDDDEEPEEDEEDEEPEEEPEPPKRTRRPAAKKAAARSSATTKKRRSKPVEDDDEDIDELDLEDL